MNFLAHAVLAGSQADIVAGSAAGDFIKGVLYDDHYPKRFLFGVRLHRRIDAFSNQEPCLRASANRLPSHLRRIGPPCIDMIADHFLARATEREPLTYLPTLPSATPVTNLEEYEDGLHRLLADHWQQLPPGAQRFFTHAKTTRLFSNYADFDRVSRGIRYVCERLGRAEDGPAMVAAMATQIDALESDFTTYWPALLGEAERFFRVNGSEVREGGG